MRGHPDHHPRQYCLRIHIRREEIQAQFIIFSLRSGLRRHDVRRRDLIGNGNRSDDQSPKHHGGGHYAYAEYVLPSHTSSPLRISNAIHGGMYRQTPEDRPPPSQRITFTS